jgi:hypothetical protein
MVAIPFLVVTHLLKTHQLKTHQLKTQRERQAVQALRMRQPVDFLMLLSSPVLSLLAPGLHLGLAAEIAEAQAELPEQLVLANSFHFDKTPAH